jgi:hypothetical protein
MISSKTISLSWQISSIAAPLSACLAVIEVGEIFAVFNSAPAAELLIIRS